MPASLLIMACPASATPDPKIQIIVAKEELDPSTGMSILILKILNEAERAETVILPERVEARIEDAGGARTILLSRAADTPSEVRVTARGFAQASYSLPPGKGTTGSLVSIPAWSTQTVRLTAPQPINPAIAQTQEDPETVGSIAMAPPTDRRAGNAFADNLSVYEPIYAVYGPGTNSAARIQISFKYRLFGSQGNMDKAASWVDGLQFAYTQRMFWDLRANSLPFRNIDFQPELIYTAPFLTLNEGISLSAQAGIRHESNGRDGLQSRSINSIYVAPMAAIPLASDYSLTLAPRVSLFIGDKSDNPDIVRYRGNAGLFMEVGQAEGLRLSTSTRFNFGSGKGAFSADLSYPLPRLLGGGPNFYLFAQSFYGYGENLLDYNKKTTRLRIGVALVR